MASQALRAVFGRRGVTAIAMLAVAALLLLSLVSYASGDPVLLLKTGTHETVTNWLGPTGALLAEVILQLLGVIGFALPLVLIQAGRRRLRPAPPEGDDSTAVRILILASLAVSATGLASLAQQVFGDGAAGGPAWSGSFAWGGIGGSLLATALSGAMNRLGAGLVLGTVGLMGYAALREWGFGGPALKEHDSSQGRRWISRLLRRFRPAERPPEELVAEEPEIGEGFERPSWRASGASARGPTRKRTPPPNASRWPGRAPGPTCCRNLKNPARAPAPGAWNCPRSSSSPGGRTSRLPRSGRSKSGGRPSKPRVSNTGYAARWTASSRGRWSRPSSSGWAKAKRSRSSATATKRSAWRSAPPPSGWSG